jgi:hypothetical protein
MPQVHAVLQRSGARLVAQAQRIDHVPIELSLTAPQSKRWRGLIAAQPRCRASKACAMRRLSSA